MVQSRNQTRINILVHEQQVDTCVCIYIFSISYIKMIAGSDNGLSPDRRQASVCTNAGILLTGPVETNLREILIEIDTFSSNITHFKMSFGKKAAILSWSQCVKTPTPDVQYYLSRCQCAVLQADGGIMYTYLVGLSIIAYNLQVSYYIYILRRKQHFQMIFLTNYILI